MVNIEIILKNKIIKFIINYFYSLFKLFKLKFENISKIEINFINLNNFEFFVIKKILIYLIYWHHFLVQLIPLFQIILFQNK